MGIKEDEFIRRLQTEGITADEAHQLRLEVEAERARERAPTENTYTFEDSRVQRLSDLWFSQRETSTIAQKDRVGLAYIAKVLSLGKETARRFAEGDSSASYEVGMRQGGAIRYEPDLKGFWEEIRDIFPDVYTDEDIQFLTERGGLGSTWHLQNQIEIQLAEESPVLGRLHVNAHAYK